MSAQNARIDSWSYPEWRDLPVELLATVSKHVNSIQDFLSFRGVCSSWRSAATFGNFDGATPRVPWLMCVSIEEGKKESEGNSNSEDKEVVVVSGEKGKRGSGVHGKKIVASLFDLSTKKALILNNVKPKEGERRLSCGGWVLCVSESSGQVYLTHPVWPIKIELPDLDTIPGYTRKEGVGYFKKMVLSGSPTRKLDLLVMVIWGTHKQLGFSRPGDLSWTLIGAPSDSFCDILYHSQRLYAVDSSKRVVEFDVHGPNPDRMLQVFSLPSNAQANEDDPLAIPIPLNDHLFRANGNGYMFPAYFMHYLVESSGKFLIVSRRIADCRTYRFQILEVDLRNGSHKEIKHLGKRAIFLGLNSSLCLELPNGGLVKPNHVYFTDDHSGWIKYLDMGVSGLTDSSPLDLPHGCSGAFLAPPLWVVPSF